MDLTRTPHETLSDREYDVMSRIASGKTVTEIADELSLSAKTISTYRARVLDKLGVKNSAAIVQHAIRNGLVCEHVPHVGAAVQPATSCPAFSLPVRQTPTHLSACVLRKHQPGADGHDRRRDLFSHPVLKRNQILAKSKLKKELYHETE